MTLTKRYWHDDKPTECQVCHGKLIDTFWDALTIVGGWGILCDVCHRKYGYGFGTGKGQQYNLATREKLQG